MSKSEIKVYHLYYVIIIFIIIIIFIVTLWLKNDKEAFNSFSFASTLVSIVLAVVSIFFSIISSQRMNASYDKFKGLKTDIEEEVTKIYKMESLPNHFESDIEIFIGHDTVNVTRLMQNAKQYIFLHAAYYPKYGVDEQGEIIKQALEHNHQLKLSVTFSSTSKPWIGEFAKILRPHFTQSEYKKACDNSKVLFENLQKTYGENRICINETERLPMFPIIMIDDYLIIGFYSHSRVIAPHGLWLKIRNKNVTTMYEKMKLHGNENVGLSNFSNEEKAIYRFVEEIYNSQSA